MEPISLSNLLDTRQTEKRINQAMELSRKAATAIVKNGVSTIRSALSAAAATQKSRSSCRECNDAPSHSDVKNYVCPPPDLCLPRCLASIQLRARPGESRIVPFGVRNTSNGEKTYLVGVRPFVDAKGQSIGISMALSETAITIQPGKMVMLELHVSIPKTLFTNSSYETDIVLREAINNQNICFSIVIEGNFNVPVACPFDEKYLNIKFHRWHHHFYCTPQSSRFHEGVDPAGRPIDETNPIVKTNS
jgi:hypothetical protein